ncbi:MAG TPA: hypothetical protein VE957_19085 [Terriglobales bacterium]|nr:hypothetical protein [Terriglobales bacterium]
MFSKLTDEQLALLGPETYGKEQWSEADVRTLRECWHEYQRRGEDTITLFRPAYSNALTFHEIDSGEVGEERVQMYERTGAEIAPDYRKVLRKLRGIDVAPYEKPEDLPQFEEWEALEELIRITSQEAQNESPDC